MKNLLILTCWSIFSRLWALSHPVRVGIFVKSGWNFPILFDRWPGLCRVALLAAAVGWACMGSAWAGPCLGLEDCRETPLDGGTLSPGQAAGRVFHCAGETPYLAGWERAGSPCASVSARWPDPDAPGRLVVEARNWCLEVADFGVVLACVPVRPACAHAGEPERDPGCRVSRTGTVCLERLEGGGCREGRAWLEECSDGRVYDCFDAGIGRPCRQCP